MSYLDTIIDFFPSSVYVTERLGQCTLRQMLDSIRSPKPEIEEKFRLIEKASVEGDKELKAKLKSQLFYFILPVCTNGKGRTYEHISHFNGLGLIDIDNLEPELAVEIKRWLFDTYPFVIASFLSASKCGVKAIVRIPIAESIEEFKSFMYAIFSELEIIKGFDPSSQNPMLPSYLTYDRDLLMREDTIVFDRKGYKVDEFKIQTEDFEQLEVNLADVPKIRRMLKYMIEQVDVDQTAHLKIRSVGLLAGGYIGAGYFETEEIKEYLFDLMEQTVYLHKGMRGYKLTLVQMINRGLLAPIIYEDER